MKRFVYFPLFLCLAICFISCEEDQVRDIFTIEADDIMGTWRSVDVRTNGIKQENISESIILNLEEDDFYFKNYVSGSWNVSRRQLTLSPNDNLEIDDSRYTIVAYTDSSLYLMIRTTEEAYYYNFPEYEDGEIITITEQYEKEK